jgi:hypothetical protein
MIKLHRKRTLLVFSNTSVFGNMIIVAFQNTFHSEIYQNNNFLFLKIIFNISAPK